MQNICLSDCKKTLAQSKNCLSVRKSFQITTHRTKHDHTRQPKTPQKPHSPHSQKAETLYIRYSRD